MQEKRVTLYIDAANLILTARDFQLQFNIYWLLEHLKFRYKINKCIYFTGRLESLKTDYGFLESLGVEIVFKEIYREEDGKTKANCDVEISHRITYDLEHDLVDKVILISGDGDFYSLLKYVEFKQKQVKLIGVVKKKTSRLYKEGMKFDLTYLTQILNETDLNKKSPEITPIKGENLVGPLVPTRLFLGTNSLPNPQNLSSDKN